jgi:hypothetical protein
MNPLLDIQWGGNKAPDQVRICLLRKGSFVHHDNLWLIMFERCQTT